MKQNNFKTFYRSKDDNINVMKNTIKAVQLFTIRKDDKFGNIFISETHVLNFQYMKKKIVAVQGNLIIILVRLLDYPKDFDSKNVCVTFSVNNM